MVTSSLFRTLEIPKSAYSKRSKQIAIENGIVNGRVQADDVTNDIVEQLVIRSGSVDNSSFNIIIIARFVH